MGLQPPVAACGRCADQAAEISRYVDLSMARESLPLLHRRCAFGPVATATSWASRLRLDGVLAPDCPRPATTFSLVSPPGRKAGGAGAADVCLVLHLTIPLFVHPPVDLRKVLLLRIPRLVLRAFPGPDRKAIISSLLVISYWLLWETQRLGSNKPHRGPAGGCVARLRCAWPSPRTRRCAPSTASLILDSAMQACVTREQSTQGNRVNCLRTKTLP